MAHRLKLMLLAAAALPGLVACGSSTSRTPSASSETSAAQVKLFDPCTGIPDSALTTAGVDPATKESGIAGVHQSGWEICNWKGAKYYVTVFSTGAPSRSSNTKKATSTSRMSLSLVARAGGSKSLALPRTWAAMSSFQRLRGPPASGPEQSILGQP